MDDLLYDAALASALVILEIIDESPGAPKPELLSKITFIVLQGMEEAERLKKLELPIPSAN